MHECPSRCTSSQRSAHSFRLRRKPSQPDETSTGPRGEPSAPPFPVGRAHLHVELLQAARANEPPPATGDTVLIHYACRLASTGGCVDSSRSKVGTARAPLSVVLGSGAAGIHPDPDPNPNPLLSMVWTHPYFPLTLSTTPLHLHPTARPG